MKFYEVHSYDNLILPETLWDGFPEVKGKSVFIKPNLVTPCSRWDAHSTTRVEVTEAVIKKLMQEQVEEIIVGECGFKNQWEATIQSTGYDQLLKYPIKLIPLQDGPNFHKFTLKRLPKGSYQSLFGARFSDYMLNCDIVINLPKLKVHNMARMTGAIKNMMGTMAQKGSMHPRCNIEVLHKRLADFYQLTQPMVNFILMDGIIGQEFSEQCGRPVQSNVLFSGTDQWEIDAAAALLMNIPPKQIPYLRYISDDFSNISVPEHLIKSYEEALRWRK